MSSIVYTIDLKDENGNLLFADVSLLVDVNVRFDINEPIVNIEAVSIATYDTPVALAKSQFAIWRILEGHIVSQLAADADFYGLALKEASIEFIDYDRRYPDGRYIQRER